MDKNAGEIGDDDGYHYISSPDHLGLVDVIMHVEASSSSLSRTTDGTAPHPLARKISVNGAAFQSTKI